MGEAIITRAGGGEADTVIPITPGYHTILVTARDYENKILQNFKIKCKDGSKTYEYTTNSKGQTMFVCNSGAANICLDNNINGIQYLDFDTTWKNVDAPVGLTSRIDINATKSSTSFYEFTNNKKFGLMQNRKCDIILVGGGGSGQFMHSSSGKPCGGGGGAGYLNEYNDQTLFGIYDFIVGAGGAINYINDRTSTNGLTGGTSYIANTQYSAIGGQGGSSNKAIGGLGNGGAGGPVMGSNGGNSTVDFAGGGGGSGGGYTSNEIKGIGGTPYGGNGAYLWGSGESGTRGGGGGGGGYNSSQSLNPGRGGDGLMRINIKYD